MRLKEKITLLFATLLALLCIKKWKNGKEKVITNDDKSGNKFSCIQTPPINNIKWNNGYWQYTATSYGYFYLYSAYLDLRERNSYGPSVRIFSYIEVKNKTEPPTRKGWERAKWRGVKMFCQIWFSDVERAVYSEVAEFRVLWFVQHPGLTQEYMITCPLPDHAKEKIPTQVSLVEKPCDLANNNLKVTYNPSPTGQKKDFAVCVRRLAFPDIDISVRLAEWIELISMFGADKIFLYIVNVDPRVQKIIDHYIGAEKVQGTYIDWPDIQATRKKGVTQQEIHISFNDCLYQNMYKYKYIALLDIDEAIVPLGNTSNWAELMEEVGKENFKLKSETIAAYHFRNIYFVAEFTDYHLKTTGSASTALKTDLDKIPHNMHILRNVYRQKRYSTGKEALGKCFHNTEEVLALHNHFPLQCLSGTGRCPIGHVKTSLAHVQHWRKHCKHSFCHGANGQKLEGENFACSQQCLNDTVYDPHIWKYKDKLIKNIDIMLANTSNNNS